MLLLFIFELNLILGVLICEKGKKKKERKIIRSRLGIFYGENTRESERKLIKTFFPNPSFQIEENWREKESFF